MWILMHTGDGEVRAFMRWMTVDRTWVACIVGSVGPRSVADFERFWDSLVFELTTAAR